MKKRLIVLLLAASMLLPLLALGGCSNPTGGVTPGEDRPSGSQPGGNQEGAGGEGSGETPMTRGQWIALLGRTMGMDEYQGTTAYFRDVPASSEFYPYVQSCYEWGVLEQGDGLLHVDDPATPEFVARTAALATGTVPESILADEAAVLAYAEERGLLPGGEDIPGELGQELAETTQRIYLDDAPEDTVEVTMAEGVVRLSESVPVTVEDDRVVLPAELAQELAAGTVFLTPPTAGNPGGVARKVVSVTDENGQTVLQTEEPDLGEVFDEVILYETAVPDMSSITLGEGVVMGPTATTTAAVNGMDGVYVDGLLAGENSGRVSQTRGASFSLNFNFTKGTMSAGGGTDNHKLTVDSLMPDFATGVISAGPRDELGQLFDKTSFIKSIPITKDGIVQVDENGWEQQLSLENEFKGSYELTGGIEIKDLYLDTGFEFKKVFGIPTGIKKVTIEVNSDIVVNGTLKGELNEELYIAAMPINVGGIGTVEVRLALYVDGSGQLQVRAELDNNVKFEYSGGNIKKTKKTEQSIAGEASLEVEFGPRLGAVLKVVGIKIIDVSVDVGVNCTISGTFKIACAKNTGPNAETGRREEVTTYTGSLAVESHVRLPVITLKVGYDPKTLANKINIKYAWTLLSKEDAPVDWQPDFCNHEWVLWTFEDRVELEPDPEESAAPDGSANPEEGTFSLESYTLMIRDMMPQQVTLTVPEGAQAPAVTWSIEDPAVAVVNESGLVTPMSGGVTVLTVTSRDDPAVTIKCVVMVEQLASDDGWEFLPSDLSVKV